MLLLVNDLHEKKKASQKVRTDEILAALTCYLQFAFILHEKCTSNFFMYIVIIDVADY